MVEIDADLRNWEAAVVKWAVATRTDIAEALRIQAKRTTGLVVRMTPPMKSLAALEPWGTQKRLGEAAVERDVKRLFTPLDEVAGSIKNPALKERMEEAVAARDMPSVFALMNVLKMPQDVVRQPTEALHNRWRDNRGRVRRQRSRYLVISRGAVNAFVRMKKRLVGRAKGGWAAAANVLGVALPAWIKRHPEQGAILDEADKRDDPSITIRNTVSYMQRLEADVRFVRLALKNAALRMEGELKKRAEAAWRKANEKTGR